MRELGVRGAVIAIVCSAAAAHAGGALDKPAFTAKPDELLAEGKAASSADAATIVLRDETTISFDEAGRAERRARVVFVVKKQSAVDDWGSLELDFRPFYQDKPTIRARVITTSGQVAELDQSLITDAPAVSESPSVFSDRRELHVPLPRLAVGAVIEEEIVTKDREPLLKAGVVDGDVVGRGVPVQRTIITISAPSSRKLHVVPRGFAKAPSARQTTSNNRTTWLYDFGPTQPHTPREDAVPSEVATWSTIGVSTGASWQAVADDYRRLVEQRLTQGGFVVPDQIKGATPRETLDRAVAWLHEHVRYTGIEFSDAAITPWPPAETTKRGFGDCKDKAALLVAILRGVGIRADLALLSDGPGRDIDRDLPGMGAFDHAIVRAKLDGKDVWIDATEDLLPPGQLPARDQGRLALVAAADTRDLVRTPVSSPADNVIREVRTYHLPEHDRVAITEVSQQTGVFWDDQRGWLRNTARDAVSKRLTSYVDQLYLGKLATFSSDDPGDVTRPSSLTVEITDSTRAFTKRREIDVYLFAADTLTRVPWTLKDADDDQERHFEFAWYMPHVYEIENRLVLPPGYTMPHLTAHDQRALGSLTLTTDRRVDHDTLVITYRLDTGKLRLTPTEVLAARKAIKDLRKQDGEHIIIAHTASALAQQGKIKEAIAECQRLIALHPKEAGHYDQLADVYREAGMGAAARRAAQKAIDVEPSSDAYDILAFQLRHDTLGREYGFDADRKGALAAYKKSLQLNPKHIGALADYASLLVSEQLGASPDKRDRQEAITMWRRAKEEAKNDAYDKPILTQLMFVGAFADAEATARAMPESRERSMDLVAAVAASRGAREAITLASSLASNQNRKNILADAAGELVLLRRYDLARALFDEAKGPDTDPNQVALMTKVTPIDFAKLDASDPKTPALQAFAVLTGDTIAHPPWDAALTKELVEGAASIRHLPAMRTWRAMPRAVATDMIVALAQPSVDGSAAEGWHVAMDVGVAKMHFYVTSDHGKAYLLGATDMAGGVGRQVQSLVAKGDLKAAARWMKWVVADAALSGAKSPYAPLVKLFKDEHATGAGATPSKELLDVAAGILLAKDDPKLAVPILRRCAATAADVKKQCRAYLSHALLELEQWADLADVERERAEADPTLLDSIALRAEALARLKRFKEARDLIDQALAKSPDELDLQREKARIETAAGSWTDGQAALDALIANPAAEAMDFNNAAWAHLLFDPTPDKAHELASRAERMKTPISPVLASTISTIEAHAERPYSAWSYTLKSLAANPDEKPNDDDWYVIGRIAESYGLRDDALAAYRKVGKSKSETMLPSAYQLAQKGLQRLGAH